MNQTTDDLALSLREYQELYDEIELQPRWRAIADKEMDYADGNQLDSDLLRRQAELGIPPAVEDMIGPTMLSLQGYESTTRTDWRVTPNGDPGGQDVADALNFKLNQAERESKADRACSKAFRPQIACGIGWVEVARDPDPIRYPYRVSAVHRNEMHWDMNFSRSAFSSSNRCCRCFNRLSNFSIRLSYCSFSRISVVSRTGLPLSSPYFKRSSASILIRSSAFVFTTGSFCPSSTDGSTPPKARRISTNLPPGMVSIFLEPLS